MSDNPIFDETFEDLRKAEKDRQQNEELARKIRELQEQQKKNGS